MPIDFLSSGCMGREMTFCLCAYQENFLDYRSAAPFKAAHLLLAYHVGWFVHWEKISIDENWPNLIGKIQTRWVKTIKACQSFDVRNFIKAKQLLATCIKATKIEKDDLCFNGSQCIDSYGWWTSRLKSVVDFLIFWQQEPNAFYSWHLNLQISLNHEEMSNAPLLERSTTNAFNNSQKRRHLKRNPKKKTLKNVTPLARNDLK